VSAATVGTRPTITVVLVRFLRDRQRSTVWWIAGVTGLVVFTVAFWPTVRGQSSFDDMIAELPEAMRAMFGFDDAVSLGSPAGYLQGRMFATMLPLVLVSCGIGLGARAIAGSESDGTLQSILVAPVERGDLYTARLAAALVLLTAPAVAAAVLVLVVSPPFGLLDGVSMAGFAAALLGAWALAALHCCLALAVGAATGRREVAVAVAGGVAVTTYLLQGLLAAAAAPAVVRNLIPWYWYLERNMLATGPAWRAVFLPVAVGAVLVAAGRIVFVRRDLR
jgi:ABC-2 type transport system permease protein